jgi:hypothetical protein
MLIRVGNFVKGYLKTLNFRNMATELGKPAAKVLVVLLSNALLRSAACLVEIHTALENNIPLILLPLEDRIHWKAAEGVSEPWPLEKCQPVLASYFPDWTKATFALNKGTVLAHLRRENYYPPPGDVALEWANNDGEDLLDRVVKTAVKQVGLTENEPSATAGAEAGVEAGAGVGVGTGGAGAGSGPGTAGRTMPASRIALPPRDIPWKKRLELKRKKDGPGEEASVVAAAGAGAGGGSRTDTPLSRGTHLIHYSPSTIHHTHSPYTFTIHHTPYTILHTPYTPSPRVLITYTYTAHHTPYAPSPQVLISYTIHSYTIHHTPYFIYHTPYTIHHTPYTIHHTSYTIHSFFTGAHLIHHTQFTIR